MRIAVRDTLPGIGAIVVGIAVWEIVGRAANVEWLPPTSSVLGRGIELWNIGLLQPAIAASLTNLLIGYAISVVVGLALGTWMGVSEKAVWAFGLVTSMPG